MDNNLTENILDNLHSTFLRNELTDIHLICSNKVFKAHLAILYASCNYFAEKIDCQLKENDSIPICIKMDDISPIMLESILNFIYTGKVTGLGWNDVYDIFKAANTLKFDPLINICYNFIRNNLSCSTFLGTYQFSKQFDIKYMLNLCLTFIAHNFLELLQNGILNEFSYEEFNTLLCDKRLLIRRGQWYYCDSMYEHTLMKCLKKWSNLNLERMEYEPQLISNIKSSLTLYSINFKTYSVPYSQTFLLNRAYGNHWDIDLYENNPRFKTCANYPPNEWFIKGMVFLIVPNWEERNVIAGINVIYKNRITKVEETFKCFPEQSDLYQIETMILEDDERIFGLTISHGWMIYSITIATSLDRIFGPYGSTSDDVESYLNLRRQTPLALYLHGFSYVPCKINNLLYINKMKISVATLDRQKYLHDFVDILSSLEIDRLERLNRMDLHDHQQTTTISRSSSEPQWLSANIPTLRERPRTAIGNLMEMSLDRREIIDIQREQAGIRRNGALSSVINLINNMTRLFR